MLNIEYIEGLLVWWVIGFVCVRQMVVFTMSESVHCDAAAE